MLELEDARQRILSAIASLGSEIVPVVAAADRVFAESVTSSVDLPLFDNSAMDGYAVRVADLAGANADQPVSLRLCGQAAAGETFDGQVEPGMCARVFTGSLLPNGADAVVMQEDTRVDPDRPGTIWFLDAVTPWENIRFRGEDVKRGGKLAEEGQCVSAGRVGLLGAAGLKEVRVGKRPCVALLATGSELIEAGQSPAPGRIYESNRAMLAALVRKAAGEPTIFPLVPDTLPATRAALERAFTECDAVVTTGGVSVGEFDFIKQAFAQLGGELAIWRVSVKPGKPFVFGRVGVKLFFGLPGNPVSALVTFLLLARPALLRMQGAADVDLPKVIGVLAEALVNRGDRRHFMRVCLDDAGRVRSAGTQASHMLTSLARANGLVDVPPRATLAAGATVPVWRWET